MRVLPSFEGEDGIASCIKGRFPGFRCPISLAFSITLNPVGPSSANLESKPFLTETWRKLAVVTCW